MKTPVVIGVVVAHVALGALLMTQGCGTTKPQSTKPVVFDPPPAVRPMAPPPSLLPPKVAPPRAPMVEAEDEEDDIFTRPVKPVKGMNREPSKEIFKETVKEPVKPKTPVAAPKSYKIQSGDSLGYIAQRFKTTIGEIKELNPSIKNVAKIREGATIKLPAYVNLSAPKPPKPRKIKPVAPPAPTAPAPAPGPAPYAPAGFAPTAPVTGAAGEYTVVDGDFPGKIAKKLGVKEADLMAANKITDPKKLKIGQKLVVPGAAAAPTAFPTTPVDALPMGPLPVYDATSSVPAYPVTPAAPAVGPAPLAPAVGPAPAAPVAPAVGLAPVAGPAPAVPGTVPRPGMQKHSVAPGETLKDIAMLYTVTVSDIMRANNMATDAVAAGQQLVIPPAQ